MEMTDILNGLSSCDESSSDNTCNSDYSGSGNSDSRNTCNNNNNNAGISPALFNGGCGCGLNSWIWILLILFYCGCGNGFLGGYNNASNNSCCCNTKNCCCNTNNCCCNNYSNNNGLNGMLGSCSAYLFLLVILFLCNGWNGIGGFGNGLGYGTGLANAANLAY